VITRLLDGEYKDRTGSHGRTYVEQLAYEMLLDPKAAAKAIAIADARARGLPQLKAAVDRAKALNAPKQALLDRLAGCKTLFADETFFRHFPARLHPLFPWQPARAPIHPLEGVYLPLNRWGAPLGEGRDWDGEFADYVAQAWHFNLFPEGGEFDHERHALIDEGVYDIGCSHHLGHYLDGHAPAFLASYAGRLRRLLAEAKPSVGAL
jgi:hypothetical protein